VNSKAQNSPDLTTAIGNRFPSVNPGAAGMSSAGFAFLFKYQTQALRSSQLLFSQVNGFFSKAVKAETCGNTS
jgi:hypothetical protein